MNRRPAAPAIVRSGAAARGAAPAAARALPRRGAARRGAARGAFRLRAAAPAFR
ncbi:hypothetical protein WME76_25725 [Sorangium sp. So ce119]|uniref:hypothetical protein n=1 Tax=Sorangium sp. So ce119 TaxID=3133279 RepID=UPI003F628A9D